MPKDAEYDEWSVHKDDEIDYTQAANDLATAKGILIGLLLGSLFWLAVVLVILAVF